MKAKGKRLDISERETGEKMRNSERRQGGRRFCSWLPRLREAAD